MVRPERFIRTRPSCPVCAVWHNQPVNRDVALQKLRDAKQAMQALGVVHLFLFGSTARGEAEDASDIDVFIDRDPSAPIGLLELGRMESTLESLVGVDVDLTTRGGLHPMIREDVERHAIKVF